MKLLVVAALVLGTLLGAYAREPDRWALVVIIVGEDESVSGGRVAEALPRAECLQLAQAHQASLEERRYVGVHCWCIPLFRSRK